MGPCQFYGVITLVSHLQGHLEGPHHSIFHWDSGPHLEWKSHRFSEVMRNLRRERVVPRDPTKAPQFRLSLQPEQFTPVRPGKLTWNPKMKAWKMIFLFKRIILRFHVNFRGCILFDRKKGEEIRQPNKNGM